MMTRSGAFLLIGLAISILAVAGANAEDPPLASFDGMQQRPLFTPSRHAATAISATRLSAAGLRLIGLISESGRTIGLIRSDEQKGDVRIGPGASLNGWVVTQIGRDGLDLSGGGQQRHVGIKQMIPASPE
jgi:hypothetical protein